jgi:hypothetical protein
MDGVDQTSASKRVYVMAATNRMGQLKLTRDAPEVINEFRAYLLAISRPQ